MVLRPQTPSRGIKTCLNVVNTYDSFDGLSYEIKNTIIEKSKIGKFIGIIRTLRRKNAKYRKEFLDLIETFTSTNQYDELLEKLKMFVTKTRSGNTATLTGIISALQPNHFMVYNQRSSLPLRDTIYRRILQNTGRGLVELDTIANDRYWDNRDSNQNEIDKERFGVDRYALTHGDLRHKTTTRSAV